VRRTIRIFAWLLAVLLLLAVAIYALLSTTVGARLLLGAAHLAGVDVQVGRVAGSVLGPLDLHELRYQASGLRVSAAEVELHWSPGALLQRRLEVQRFAVRNLQVKLPKSSTPSRPFEQIPQLPARLPFAIHIGEATIDHLELQQAGQAPQTVEKLTLRLGGDRRQIILHELSAQLPGVGPVALAGQARLGQQALRIAALRLSGSGSLLMQGTLGYGRHASDLTLQWKQLHWPADRTKPQQIAEVSGQARVTGVPRAYHFDIGTTATRDQRRLALSAKGSGGLGHLQFADLQASEGEHGRIDGHGGLRWKPSLQGTFQLTLEHLDPQAFVAGFPGDLNGALDLNTRDADDVQFNLHLAHSRLRGRPLTLAAQGVLLNHKQVKLTAFSLRSARTKVTGSGTATPPFDLQARIDSPDLADLAPDLGGSLEAQLQLQGTLADPHLRAEAHGRKLRLPGATIARLDLDADLDPQRPSRLKLTAAGSAAGVAIHSLQLSGHGDLGYQHLKLQADTSRGTFDLALAGGYNRKRKEWGGTLLSSRVAPAGLPPLVLQQSAGLLLGERRLSLENACWAGGEGKLCLRVLRNVGKPGILTRLSLDALHLVALQPLLPKGWKLTGEATGKGALEVADGNVRSVDARLDLGGGRVTIPGVPVLDVRASKLTVHQDAKGVIAADAALHLSRGDLQFQATIGAGQSFVARSLAGQVRVTVPDIAFLQPFTPGVTHLAGHVQGRFQLAGKVARPRLSGSLELLGGSAHLTAPNIDLSPLKLQVTADGSGPLKVSGSASSGHGTLELLGAVDPTARPLRVVVHVKGDHFQAMNTPQARLEISPDLRLQYLALPTLPDLVALTGTLDVPKATITPSGFTDSGIAPSSDQILIGGQSQERSKPLHVAARVTLNLGKQVSFRGFGLSTDLAGGVTLVEYPNQKQTFASGVLRLENGRYKAYGQDLQIDQGRLIYTGGSVTKPGVDLKATRKASSSVSVSVHVQGTLDSPSFSLQSDPPMPRDQQLAWLVLGHPLDQSSTGEQQAVANAALGLGIAGGGAFAQKLGKDIGLDTVELGSSSAANSPVAASQGMVDQITGSSSSPQAQAAQVTLGKYLTPRLYVSYGVGLLTPGNTFRLLYDLGHGFKLQAESGTASGGDLLYTVQSK
jgi:Uncharacterized protein conserved in bacteria